MTIELVYDPDCPHVEETRLRLRKELEDLGLPRRWTEIDRTAPGAPERVRALGSPTVLVDGRDVSGPTESGVGACCRVYRTDGGTYEGSPGRGAIRQALSEASEGMA